MWQWGYYSWRPLCCLPLQRFWYHLPTLPGDFSDSKWYNWEGVWTTFLGGPNFILPFFLGDGISSWHHVLPAILMASCGYVSRFSVMSNLLKEKECGLHFLFFPIPGDEGKSLGMAEQLNKYQVPDSLSHHGAEPLYPALAFGWETMFKHCYILWVCLSSQSYAYLSRGYEDGSVLSFALQMRTLRSRVASPVYTL